MVPFNNIKQLSGENCEQTGIDHLPRVTPCLNGNVDVREPVPLFVGTIRKSTGQGHTIPNRIFASGNSSIYSEDPVLCLTLTMRMRG